MKRFIILFLVFIFALCGCNNQNPNININPDNGYSGYFGPEKAVLHGMKVF